MRLPEEPDIAPQINIVPMIDVIFAILTFFIISTLFLTQSQGLPVNLPKAATGARQSVSQVNVTIDPNGQITLNRKPTQLNELNTQVRGLVGSNPQALVVINADGGVSHSRVVAVMDQLRQVPGVRLAIGTQP